MRFLADENFNNEILRGLQRRLPDVAITRAQDTELASQPDPQLLAWAAEQGYLILSHDVNTLRGYFMIGSTPICLCRACSSYRVTNLLARSLRVSY